MEEFDCVVAGAGVVGLAVARALALAGREVLVLDAAEGIGTETSSRNSEVIHAGIYYPAGSLMARACVAGKQMLYAYCAERSLPHANCGKLIVATDAEEAERLASIQARAAANGVPDLRRLTRAEALALEPALACTAALLSPSTGIIDSHAYMLSLQGDAENAGAIFVFHAPVLGGRVTEDGIEIEVGGAEPMALRCRSFINAAGLHAPKLARGLVGMPQPADPDRLLRQGQLLQPDRQEPLLPADLPGAGAGRARHPSDHRPRRPGALRARCRMGRQPRLRGRSRAAATASTPPSAATGRI